MRYAPTVRTSPSSRAGYGLVVIAALFTAFSIIAAAAIERNNVSIALDQQIAAKAQLRRLNKAILLYARANSNRFPCPASQELAYSNASFGVAVTNCYTGAAASGTVLLTGTPGNDDVNLGMVPVRTLIPYGISLSDAFDPWNDRITYAVHRQMTPSGSGSVGAGERVTVMDLNTGSYYGDPDFVLISFGKDRMGGRIKGQSVLTSALVTCVGADRRGENCDNDNVLYVGPPVVFTSANTSTEYFDDILSWFRL
jgi:hypothetical protein